METVESSSSSAEFLRAQAHIWRQAFSFQNSAVLKCAVELGIPDAIQQHGKPMSLSDLTSALPINPSKAPSIHRLMRVLVNTGFCAQEKECFALTSAGRLLLKDDPRNARAFVKTAFDPALIKPWNSLSEWFQNDDLTAFHTAHGKSLWDYTAYEPKFRKLFDEGMAGDSELVAKVLLTECKYVFEGLTSLVDVGGGTGTLARAIAEAFPNLKCTVCDLPQVVANQERDGNLDFVAGDMFDKVPSANAILLKWTLHNWSDENCVKILKNCKRAIPGRDEGGKVIIIDMIMDKPGQDNESTEAQICMDMQMLAIVCAKQRTEKEWAKLFLDAGFTSYQVFPVSNTQNTIFNKAFTKINVDQCKYLKYHL